MLEAFLPTMMKKNKGHIVAISSIAGVVGSPNIAPYCASKFAVKGKIRSRLCFTYLKIKNKELKLF